MCKLSLWLQSKEELLYNIFSYFQRMTNEDWFDNYYKTTKLMRELTSSSSSSNSDSVNNSIYNDPKRLNYINNINAMLLRIKVLIEELNYIDTMYKLKSCNSETLQKVEGTLMNVEEALGHIKKNIGSLGYTF